MEGSDGGIGVFRTALTTSLVQWSLGGLGWRELDLFAKRGRNGHSQQHYCSPLLIDFFLLIILFLLLLSSLLTLFLLSSLCFSLRHEETEETEATEEETEETEDTDETEVTEEETEETEEHCSSGQAGSQPLRGPILALHWVSVHTVWK